MNKLVELLNEKAGHLHYYLNNGCICVIGGPVISDLEIISKSYGFIQWLVDNDKIDLDKVTDRMESWMGNDNSCDIANVLMNLAISDSPVIDLIGYLK